MRVSFSIIAAVLAATLAGCTDSSTNEGFAGLAEQVEDSGGSGFRQPRPGDTLDFPDDWGPHPQHRIEWWYLTANLTTEEGRPLGVQWTQFRQGLKPRAPEQPPPDPGTWPLESAWMAHGAVSFKGEHWFAEKLARGGIGHAGARAEPFKVWLDDWQLTPVQNSDEWRLRVQGDDWRYDLKLHNNGRPVPHGDQGFSAKSASGEGSMYFSLVDLEIEGTVTLGQETVKVAGKGWFDREWSSQFLKTGQQGWDWFALHLDNGQKLMAFRLREDGSAFLSGSWVQANDDVQSLGPGDLTLRPTTWRASPRGQVPVEWQITIPSQGVKLRVEAPDGQYWNDGSFPYWESPVSVSGSHQGVGYMELTGYSD